VHLRFYTIKWQLTPDKDYTARDVYNLLSEEKPLHWMNLEYYMEHSSTIKISYFCLAFVKE